MLCPEEWIFTESLPLKKEDAEILDKLPINLHHDNERKKKSRCGSCTACLRGNCGKCTNCRDKSKKKACEKRKCPYMSYGERKVSAILMANFTEALPAQPEILFTETWTCEDDEAFRQEKGKEKSSNIGCEHLQPH